MNEDHKVSQRYRELGPEEPPRHVDEAILAASRRAAEMHPAPLVPPTGRRRWYFPLAAAAVIMLSVAVTWHMQIERPDPDGYVASAPVEQGPLPAQAPEEKKRSEEAFLAQRKDAESQRKGEMQRSPTPAPAPAPGPAPAEKPFAADPPQAARDQAASAAPERALPKPQAAVPPPEVAASRAESRMRESAPVAGARAPEIQLRKQLSEAPPEKVLERIAELRKQGKHDEADKALEEFRKRYPDYKIPESALRLPK